MEKAKQILTDITKQILIIILYIFLILTLQSLFYKGITSDIIYLKYCGYILIDLITLITFLLIFRKQLVPDFYDFKKNGERYIKKYFKYWIIGLIVMLISNIIISSFIDLATNEELNRSFLKEMPIYVILTSVIFAPIIEECLTRVILKDTFKCSFIYYLLSGLIFALLHMLSAESIYEFFYLIPYGALGFTFAMMYKKSNNIWVNIFFHSFHNFIAILLLL